MVKIIFEFGLPLLVLFYLAIDVLVPSFTSAEYFWFAKSFKSKPKGTLQEEVIEAERVYEEAKIKMEHLKDSATDEEKEAEKRLVQAKETLDNAKKKIENLKK